MKKKKKKIRDGERHSPNWFICDDRVSLTCVQSNTKRTADVAGKWTGEYLPFSGEDTWLLDSPTTLTDILMINLWEKNKKKKNEMILDVSTENMHKRRSLDGNVQEQALPIPVQMFLWRQLRYLYITYYSHHWVK